MSSFVDSVFAFSTGQPQSGGQDSTCQWTPSTEQVSVLMAEENHTQAGFPFQFQVQYQSPSHTSAIANPQEAQYVSQGMEYSSAYSALRVPMAMLPMPMVAQHKRMRDSSSNALSLPIFAEDQSADAQRKAKRSRLIREYSNGILTHANMNAQPAPHGSGNGDFSGVLDDLSIPILFPDAKPSPLLIPGDEEDTFDLLRMGQPERSPAFHTPYLFKNPLPSPAASTPATAFFSEYPAHSSASIAPIYSAPLTCLQALSAPAPADVSQMLSDNSENSHAGGMAALSDGYSTNYVYQLQQQQAVPGSLARFLPGSPTNMTSVVAEVKVETAQTQPPAQAQAQPVLSTCAPPPAPTTAATTAAASTASCVESANESACAASNTPRTLRSHDSRRHSLQQCAAQMHTPTQGESLFQGQMTPSSPAGGSATRVRRPGSPQHTPGSAVVHSSTGVAIPPLRLSAARASHRAPDSDDSNRAVKQAKRITVDLTRGGVELEVFERYYQRPNDGAEYKIRLIRLVNRRSGRSDVYCHAADLGGVVERKSNISRLFGQFESPREKILMNVIGAHSLSIGQESNILTYYGVRRFFEVSKMKGQQNFRRWIETVLLPDLQATTQVSAVQLLPPKNESDTLPLTAAGKKEKSSGRKELSDESDHELDAPPSLSSDDESSSDSTDDMEDEDEADA